VTRRVSRNGRTYSQGSHMVRGDYPQRCAGCGEFVPLNECWQETVRGVALTWHHACRLRQEGVKEGAVSSG